MLNLILVLAVGIFIRRAIIQSPELESVAWILVLLGVIVVVSMHGPVTLLEVP
jgi:hypothetical protein